MAIGDDALNAGFQVVPDDGTGAEVRWGGREINRTRDYIAQVRSLITSIWAVANGGTGANNAAGARQNLGIRSGTASPSDAVGGNQDGNIYFHIL